MSVTKPKKKVTKKAKEPKNPLGLKSEKLPWLEKVGAKLTVAQELFCQYITRNPELFNNATRSYAQAYKYDLDSLSKNDAVYSEELEDDEDKIIQRKELLVPSSYTRAEQVCAVNGARLLRNAKVAARIRELLNELLRDDVVDARLAELILQESDKAASNAAIREYNKLRKRTEDENKSGNEIHVHLKDLIFDTIHGNTNNQSGG